MIMLSRVALLVVAVGLGVGVSACTVSNPLYVARDDAGHPLVDLGHAGGDGGTTDPVDLGGADLTTPPDPGCTKGERSCDGLGSTVCRNGTFVADRTCPDGSSCHEGYCAQPTDPADITCSDPNGGQSDTVCFLATNATALTCQPYVGSGSVEWYCTPAVSTDGAGTPCMDGKTCRSGFCGSNGTCFRACNSDQECPKQASNCTEVGIAVEGQSITAYSCLHN